MTTACDQLRQRFGVEEPVFQAGMGWVSTGRLAAAVSAAGGLGVIATGGHMSAAELSEHIARVRDEAPGRPFGVNVLLPSAASADTGFANQKLAREQLDCCMRERVPVVITGLGDPSAVVGEVHAAGGKVVAVVGSARAAAKVAGAGVDAVVIQGSEAGGHVGRTATLPLAQAVVPTLEIPVLLAGGIATADGVRAALALGGAGVSVGTRFLASTESDAHENYKAAVVAAGEGSTLVTRACTGKPSRALRNRFTESWEGREPEAYPAQAIANFWRGRAAAIDGDTDDGFMPTGEAAALIDEVLDAGKIVEMLAAGARS